MENLQQSADLSLSRIYGHDCCSCSGAWRHGDGLDHRDDSVGRLKCGVALYPKRASRLHRYIPWAIVRNKSFSGLDLDSCLSIPTYITYIDRHCCDA